MEKYRIISAISNPLRIRIIEVLSRGPAPVNEIVSLVHASQPKVSSHLSILMNSGIVDSYQIGRGRIYKLCPENLEDLTGWLDNILHSGTVWKSTPKPKGNSRMINELHQSRTCYDHLAGVEGVYLLERMLDLRWLVIDNSEKPTYRLSAEGENQLSARGVRIPIRKNSRRMFAYGCLDWTVRSPHLGGALGASILRALEESGYLERIDNSRKIRMKRELSFFFDPEQQVHS